MLGRLKLALLAIVLGLYAASASAGLDQVMRDRFDAMVSSYPPGVVQGANVNTLTGGRFRVRISPQPIQIASMRAPSLKAGCGGIDIMGGSFSLISTDQLVQMLENIAASAAAFFFYLAIRSISDSIANVMETLQKQLNKLNMDMMNSCEMGRTIATGMADQLNMRTDNEARVLGAGTEGDNATSFWTTMQSSFGWLGQRNPPVAQAIMPGNIVYKALRTSLGGVFGGSNETLRQLMSVTGTIVVCTPNSNGCPIKEPDQAPGSSKTTTDESFAKPYPPTIGLRTLLDGVEPGVSAARIYECNDDVECLDPVPSPATSFVGTKRVLDDLILGPGAVTGTGLIGKWRNGVTALTANENQIDQVRHHYIGIVRGLARFNEADAREAYDDMKGVIALEWTGPLLEGIMREVLAAASRTNKAGNGQLIQLIEASNKAINDEYTTLLIEAETNSRTASEAWKVRLEKLRASSTPRV